MSWISFFVTLALHKNPGSSRRMAPLLIKRLITVYVVFFSQPIYSLIILEMSLAAKTLLDHNNSMTFNSPSCNRISLSELLLIKTNPPQCQQQKSRYLHL